MIGRVWAGALPLHVSLFFLMYFDNCLWACAEIKKFGLELSRSGVVVGELLDDINDMIVKMVIMIMKT